VSETKRNVCLVASEVAPFAKTGGLADVAAALSRALHEEGHDVRLFLPFYPRIASEDRTFVPVDFLQDVPVSSGPRSYSFSVFTTPLPGSDLPVHLVHCPALYDRPGIYTADGDEHLRFAVLARAALDCCQRMGWSPDVVHCNDWHTALIPLFLKTLYAWDRLFARTRTVLTIHNIGYQGAFPESAVTDVGLDAWRDLLHQDDLRQGAVNFLKTGILYADAITTVSETYAREIQTETYGVGLQGLLQGRRSTLFGIVNGIDDQVWNPSTDPHLPAHYDREDLSGKRKCREELLREMGLRPAGGGPWRGSRPGRRCR